jgi:hypothetical protein
MSQDKALKTIIALTDEAKTMDELFKTLHDVAYALGGMVVHFDKENRSQIIISLTEKMGTAFQLTSKHMGEPSDIEMIVGSGKR